MGTNFYTKINECKACKRFDEIHLGKSSGGWMFSFQYNGGKFYENVEEMKRWLIGKDIKNEYGTIISGEEFWKMVEEKQKPEFANHAEYCRKAYGLSDRDFIIDGYSFTDSEFS